jgi:uncharacterized protein (TIGR02246 family)
LALNTSEQPIHRLFEAYQTAVFAKNIEAYAELFDADVHVFDMWEQWSCQGLAAWRKMAADWLGSLGTDRVVVEFADIHVTTSPDLAFAHAIVTFRAVAPDGKKLREMQNRLTWVLSHRPGGWKIVHQHTSAPIDPTTAKVILKKSRSDEKP